MRIQVKSIDHFQGYKPSEDGREIYVESHIAWIVGTGPEGEEIFNTYIDLKYLEEDVQVDDSYFFHLDKVNEKYKTA